MIIGLATLSILFGGACGIAAFCAEFGAMQSLMIYAVVGLMPFLLMPLIGSPGHPRRRHARARGRRPEVARQKGHLTGRAPPGRRGKAPCVRRLR